MAISHGEITELLGLPKTGDRRVFTRVSGFAGADAESVVYAVDEVALKGALSSGAGLVLAPLALAQDDAQVLGVRNPKYAFALVAREAERRDLTADSERQLPADNSLVQRGAVVGVGTRVGLGTVIEAGAVVGRDCVIGCNVVIHAGTTVGDRCVVQSGVVLGGMGFGYVTGPDGRHVRFPQIGTLWIGDDVEIGANTAIDRGALGETRIGRGTKIDNLCHIAHNCLIGEDVLIAAQVGMAGSCVIEDRVMLGGQVGLGERVTIAKGVVLGGQGGVLPGKRIEGDGVVYWGTPAQPVREYLRNLARVRGKREKAKAEANSLRE
jgi:UDP-3-O-[3-hydroxymyristoyl] glucosamine N-acyltransferase